MPVRRPHGKSRSAVIAFTEEIDAWLHGAPDRDFPELDRLRSRVAELESEVADLGARLDKPKAQHAKILTIKSA
ncbi:MAG: hypothetical protein ACXVZQ_03395 [Terriglobales bacterium]